MAKSKTRSGAESKDAAPNTATVRIRVDGSSYQVPEGQKLLEALQNLGVLMNGVDIPHYCWHPKLSIDGSCRLCQVEVASEADAASPSDAAKAKLQIACDTVVFDGMVVDTKTERVRQAREGVMELLLLNHPLDCPICDQAGECELQDHAFDYGPDHGRTREARRVQGKRIALGPEILLDRERCILCRRCVRFCREVSGTGELAVVGRGDRSMIDCFPGAELDNAYSMNVADVCPVGALTTRDFRFKMRVWFLEPVDGICGACARGCNIHRDVAKGVVQRYRPRRNDFVNDTWMCDVGRSSYEEIGRKDRLRAALGRDGDGRLAELSIDDAIAQAAASLRALVDAKGAGVIAGIASPHVTNEDLFTLRRFLAAIGAGSGAVAVPIGEDDSLLVHAEKSANAAGARALGFADAAPLAERIRGGGIDGLVVLGSDLVTAGYLDDRESLGKLHTVIVLDTHQSALMRVAHWVLPATHLAEKHGSVTNCNDRVQRVRSACPPPGSACSEGEILFRLAVALGLEGFSGEFEVEATSLELSRTMPAFSGCDYASLPNEGRLLAKPISEGSG